MSSSFDHIEGIIWDLDNTLYRFVPEFYTECNKAAARIAVEAGITHCEDEALLMAETSLKDHGSSIHHYILNHGLSYEDVHIRYHDMIDEKILTGCTSIKNGLESIDLPFSILTNASQSWAKRVLKYLNMDHLFDARGIFAFEDAGFRGKSSTDQGFKLAQGYLGLDAHKILMIDDLDRNLPRPHAMGMTTIYLHYGDKKTPQPDFMHHQYYDAAAFMADFQGDGLIASMATKS